MASPLFRRSLTLDDTEPFRPSRNHFIIEVRVEGTLGGPLRASRSEAVTVLGKRRVPALLKNLQQGLLDLSVDDPRQAKLSELPVNWFTLCLRFTHVYSAQRTATRDGECTPMMIADEETRP
jgi:hypothetical protein